MSGNRRRSLRSAIRRRAAALVVCILFSAVGCGEQDSAQTPPEPAQTAAAPDAAAQPAPKKKRRSRRKRPKRYLSEYGLFEGKLADLKPAPGVTPFDINSPLFSDYAWKHRVVKLPEGTSAVYDDSGSFQFPVGTVIAKTFYYPHDFNRPEQGRRLIETRILLHRESGWIGVPYVWNDEQTDAVSEVTGAITEVSWKHTDGTEISNSYVVPNLNDCKRCHQSLDGFEPIGTRARHLNKDYTYDHGLENQLGYWTRTGILTGAPSDPELAPRLAVWDDETTGTVDERARSWLETNCAHCHHSRGPARNSGLFLMAGITDPYQMGVYKTPVAAGRGSGGRMYDIVPGKPDESILLFRLESTHPGIAMPEFGRTLVHKESNELIRQWIAEMDVPPGFDLSNAIGEFKSLSAQQLQQFVREVHEHGDPRRGEEILHRRRLNCFKCHAIGGVGEQVGPDLLERRDDKTVAHLVEAVLLPNKTIRKGYETETVITDAGLAISGILLKETDSELLLRDLTRPEIRVSKATIEDRRRGVSLMPSNIVAMLSRQDVVDLVRFLAELGETESQAHSAPVVRRWQVLNPIPLHSVRNDADQFFATARTRRDLVWEPAYSYLNGDLALAPPASAGRSGLRVVRCEFEAVNPGEIELRLNDATGLSIWIDGKLAKASKRVPMTLDRGSHSLAFLVDLDQRKQDVLRCEITPTESSAAQVDLRSANPVSPKSSR